MAGKGAAIRVNIVSDADTKGFREAQAAAGKLEGALEDVGKGADDQHGRFGKLRSKLGDLGDGAKDLASRSLTAVTDKLRDFGPAGDAAAGQIENLSGAFAKLGPAAVAGIGLAVAGMQRALAKADIAKRLESEFGLTEKAAADAGKTAGRVFARGFGESEAEIAGIVARIERDLPGVADAADEVKERLVAGASNIATVWGADVNQTVRAAGQLLRTGLAPDATAAMDIIVRGFQLGADRSGDFLDTLNEYAPQFESMGIDGKAALDLILTGLDAGAFNADKLGDAVKEFGDRSREGAEKTAAAIEAIGLSSEKVIAAVNAGGPQARRAFGEVLKSLSEVKDSQQRQILGAQLFGEQWVDVSADVVLALAEIDGAVQQVDGSTQALNDRVGSETATGFEALKRTAGRALDVITGQNREAAMATLERMEAERKAGDQTEATGDAAGVAARSLDIMSGVADDVARAVGDMAGSEFDAVDGAGKVARSAEDVAKAYDEYRKSVEHAQQVQDAFYSALEGRFDTQMAAERAVLDTADALVDLAAAEADARQAVTEHGEASAEAAQAQRDLARRLLDTRGTLVDQAKALADAEIAQREANGQTVDAATKNQLLRDELGRVAATLAPGSALRSQLERYAAELGEIPPDRETIIRADTAQAYQDLIHYKALIGELPQVVTTTYRSLYTSDGAPPPLTPGRPGLIQYRADGGPVRAGQPYVVGEDGQELFVPASSGTIVPNDKLGPTGGTGAAGGWGGVTVNLYGTVMSDEVPSRVADAIDRALTARRRERS